MHRIGRPEKTVPEEVLQNIISQYLSKYPTIRKIKYKDICEYARNSEVQGDFYWPPSYDYWRKKERRGRELVDEVNSKLATVKVKDSNEYVIVSTKDTFDEYKKNLSKNRDKIIAKLKINEFNLVQVISKYQNLDKKYEATLETIEILEKKIKELENRNSEYEMALFQFMDISHREDLTMLTDLITTNDKRSKLVSDLFIEMFTEPNRPYLNKVESENDNLVPINQGKKNSIIEDLNL